MKTILNIPKWTCTNVSQVPHKHNGPMYCTLILSAQCSIDRLFSLYSIEKNYRLIISLESLNFRNTKFCELNTLSGIECSSYYSMAMAIHLISIGLRHTFIPRMRYSIQKTSCTKMSGNTTC